MPPHSIALRHMHIPKLSIRAERILAVVRFPLQAGNIWVRTMGTIFFVFELDCEFKMLRSEFDSALGTTFSSRKKPNFAVVRRTRHVNIRNNL